MAPPDIVITAALLQVSDYCDRRAPAHVRGEVRVEARVRGNKITIVERCAPWHPDFGPDWSEGKVAQLAYDPRSRTWELFAYDRNERRIAYPFLEPTRDLDAVLDELERDPICIFGH